MRISFGAPPPDLSVESRVRGRDWLYNYLLGFYRDEKSLAVAKQEEKSPPVRRPFGAEAFT